MITLAETASYQFFVLGTLLSVEYTRVSVVSHQLHKSYQISSQSAEGYPSLIPHEHLPPKYGQNCIRCFYESPWVGSYQIGHMRSLLPHFRHVTISSSLDPIELIRVENVPYLDWETDKG